ncbi:MmgE/PrpD family protein [Caenimonas soli]|uniref:MmgE/PrpD family protein n=1 Tax=Caenimonas soli TaxID=2735555 RepID=UPI001553BB67|nr:MmgE/PrpD family protein [Caenimonas soli]NPC56950.1 MmgE/PrpD family protein [Caenimonas soli]
MSVQDSKLPSLSRSLLMAAARPVDARARSRAVLHWLDWIGCVAAGARAPVSDAMRRLQLTPGMPCSTPSLLGMAQDAWHATLLDAGPANVEEMDDMHRQAILHPGPVIMPALAGLARQGALSTAQTLDAVVRGYEIMIRVGRAVGTRHYYFWHNTATAGVFGAAAACADALQLSPDQAVWALGNAGTKAAGLWQVRLEPVMSKQLHTAHAAWAGRTAASLAAAGFTGPERILEGDRGFFAAMCPGADIEAVSRTEKDWLIHETSFKPWPACRHTHATIDCVLAMREQGMGGPLRFDACEVESFSDALGICDNPQPRTRTEAKFSLQYCVAVAAAMGPLRPEFFDEAFFLRPDLVEAAKRVKLKPSAAIDDAYPDHYGARVTFHLRDGETRAHEVKDSLGDPERPMTAEALFDKARMLMAYGAVPEERAEEVIQAARSLLDAPPAALAAPFPKALLAPLFAFS